MTVYVGPFPIRFQDISNWQAMLVKDWEDFIASGNLSMRDFIRDCMEILVQLPPEVLFGLVVNCSLIRKIRRVGCLVDRRLFEIIENYLSTPNAKKPLIIGFAAFLQLCRLPTQDLTSDQLCVIEELKRLLRTSIFHDDVVIRLMAIQEQMQANLMRFRGMRCYPYQLRTYFSKIGWYIFAKQFMDEGAFDCRPFSVDG